MPVRKVVCRDCRTVTYERVAFAAYKNARITRLLAKKLPERAADVSMKSLAEEYRISWRTVRDAIEDGLRNRYRRRDYSIVKNVGVDELHVFRNERPSRRFITTARPKSASAVLGWVAATLGSDVSTICSRAEKTKLQNQAQF